jgi:hypothetical protein
MTVGVGGILNSRRRFLVFQISATEPRKRSEIWDKIKQVRSDNNDHDDSLQQHAPLLGLSLLPPRFYGSRQGEDPFRSYCIQPLQESVALYLRIAERATGGL